MNPPFPHAASVEMLERQRIAAMVAGDVATLDALLHDRLVFGHTNGHADSKAAYLDKFRSGAVRYTDAAQQIVSVVVQGDTALVHGHLKLTAELKDGRRALNVIALAVWVHNEGSWQMLAHQPTAVEFDPAA